MCVASCDCHGHGVCTTIDQLYKIYEGGEYALWDKDHTTSCVCDMGYTGPGCSLRTSPLRCLCPCVCGRL